MQKMRILPAFSSAPHPGVNALSTEELGSLKGALVTLIGFGSLLSETSSRTTFPHLENFRFGRVEGWRRCFRHPAAIFFERGIARPETRQISSLSAEPAEGASFVCSLFDVPDFNMQAFVDREEEFDFTLAPYTDLKTGAKGKGLMCAVSTDARVEERWGAGYVARKYGVHGVDSIWGPHEGILPCPVYLRHCVLSAKKQGGLAYESFLKETFLADRTTTIEQHLREYPEVMTTLPPPSVANRYTG